MTEPIDLDELLSRISAALRRPAIAGRELLSFAGVTLDVRARDVRHGDRRVESTPREYALLEILIRTPGRAFSKDELLERVWGVEHEGDSGIVHRYVSICVPSSKLRASLAWFRRCAASATCCGASRSGEKALYEGARPVHRRCGAGRSGTHIRDFDGRRRGRHREHAGHARWMRRAPRCALRSQRKTSRPSDGGWTRCAKRLRPGTLTLPPSIVPETSLRATSRCAATACRSDANTPPPAARQVAIVPMQDGYVLADDELALHRALALRPGVLVPRDRRYRRRNRVRPGFGWRVSGRAASRCWTHIWVR